MTGLNMPGNITEAKNSNSFCMGRAGESNRMSGVSSQQPLKEMQIQDVENRSNTAMNEY